MEQYDPTEEITITGKRSVGYGRSKFQPSKPKKTVLIMVVHLAADLLSVLHPGWENPRTPQADSWGGRS